MTTTPQLLETAQAFNSNPDPMFAGCLNTGNNERGVVFPGVEVLEASYCFIGVTSMIEGIAAIYNITPNEARKRIEGDKKAENKLAKMDKEIADLKKQLVEWEKFKAAAEDSGLFTVALD